jgi:hypothetical protein
MMSSLYESVKGSRCLYNDLRVWMIGVVRKKRRRMRQAPRLVDDEELCELVGDVKMCERREAKRKRSYGDDESVAT